MTPRGVGREHGFPNGATKQSINNPRIELRRSAPHYLGAHFILSQRSAIRPFGRHRVDGVGKADDARGKWYQFPSYTIGIARTIPVLVMMPDRRDQFTKPSHR